ncbi:DUF3180 domain-containing protein [Actinotalea sp. K2]|uniref:DUF3180 domain-containing protein n=1 Tax=Actinotalea sp. K2 TaxID=2939438 RepID=UPI0020180B03|nr:DUF3180 domain-containing protein [Actinotalea sp. K2]MCL3861454.1 DUF3180 domain-containing protein [Actinotalea sp. K2]
MQRTRISRLGVVAGVTTAASFVVLRLIESRGGTPPPVPWLSWLVVLLIGAVVAGLGWSVRQFTRGKRPGLDPLLAARTVVLATASAYTGALLSGWYAAQVLLVIGDLTIDVRRERALAAGVALGCTVLLGVIGLVVERWCQVPPPEDDDGAGAAPSGSAV